MLQHLATQYDRHVALIILRFQCHGKKNDHPPQKPACLVAGRLVFQKEGMGGWGVASWSGPGGLLRLRLLSHCQILDKTPGLCQGGD